MEAKDLRVSNLVTIPTVGIASVYDIKQNTATMLKVYDEGKIGHFVFDYEHISGIPLSEEWLTKAGFKETTDENDLNIHYALDVKGFNIHYEIASGLHYCFLESIGIDCDKVHELQNLYFALTGTELTINF